MVFYWFGWIEIAVVCLFVFIKTAQTLVAEADLKCILFECLM